MPCTMPPELDARDLLAYLNGDADERVVEHLRACESCRRRAGDLANQEGILLKRLYRFDCPTPHVLGEYHLGMLGTADRRRVAEHVSECVHCQQELSQLDGYITDLQPDVTLDVADQVRALVARLASGPMRLLDGLVGGPLRPVAAGVRGSSASPSVYEVQGVHIAVNLDPDRDHTGRYWLIGLITGCDMTNAKVRLIQSGKTLSEAAVDSIGGFELSGLTSGTYQLVLLTPEHSIEVPRLIV